MKYVAIVGSNSKNSLNRVLANFFAKRYGSDDLSIDVLSINNLPFYSVDDELTPSQEVVAFKQAVKEADGVIWLTRIQPLNSRCPKKRHRLVVTCRQGYDQQAIINHGYHTWIFRNGLCANALTRYFVRLTITRFDG